MLEVFSLVCCCGSSRKARGVGLLENNLALAGSGLFRDLKSRLHAGVLQQCAKMSDLEDSRKSYLRAFCVLSAAQISLTSGRCNSFMCKDIA